MKKRLYLLAVLATFIAIIGATGYYFYNKNDTNMAKASDINKKQVNTVSKIDLKENKPETKGEFKDLQPKKDGQDQKEDNYLDGDSIKLNREKLQGKTKIQDRPLFPKEVFLTFDDGPSTNTLKILKLLDDNKIKATFFVIGKNVDEHPELVKAEYLDGMSIMNHSYSHDYSIYKSIEASMEDFDKCNVSIKNAIGIEPHRFIRFPGGSDNQVSNHQIMASIREAVVAKGIEYVDWNTSSGDAAAVTVPAKNIESNLLNQLANRNFAVVLMHDVQSKTTTVEALPSVINYLIKQGYVFRTFDDLTPTEEQEMIKTGVINRGVHK